MKAKITSEFEKSQQCYGARKITKKLRATGEDISIIGFSMNSRMTKELIINTLNKALGYYDEKKVPKVS